MAIRTNRMDGMPTSWPVWSMMSAKSSRNSVGRSFVYYSARVFTSYFLRAHQSTAPLRFTIWPALWLPVEMLFQELLVATLVPVVNRILPPQEKFWSNRQIANCWDQLSLFSSGVLSRGQTTPLVANMVPDNNNPFSSSQISTKVTCLLAGKEVVFIWIFRPLFGL